MKLGEAFLLDSGEVQGVVVVEKLVASQLQGVDAIFPSSSFLLSSSSSSPLSPSLFLSFALLRCLGMGNEGGRVERAG